MRKAGAFVFLIGRQDVHHRPARLISSSPGLMIESQLSIAYRDGLGQREPENQKIIVTGRQYRKNDEFCKIFLDKAMGPMLTFNL